MSSKYPYIAHSKINVLSAASFAIDQTMGMGMGQQCRLSVANANSLFTK